MCNERLWLSTALQVFHKKTWMNKGTAQVVNSGEGSVIHSGHLQVHWEHARRVRDSREVYSDWKVFVWFTFLAISGKQTVVSSWFSQQKAHSCTPVGSGLVEMWLFWRYPSLFMSMCLLCIGKTWGLLRRIHVNMVLGYIMLSLFYSHDSLMKQVKHFISLHFLLNFRDVPVWPDVHRLSLPLHRQHTGEWTEVKPDE